MNKSNMIYICSPLKGDITGNIEKALRHCKLVSDKGFIPMAPHAYFTRFLNDEIEEERSRGMSMGLEILPLCREVWVFGNVISEGMKAEIYLASTNGIPVLFLGTDK